MRGFDELVGRAMRASEQAFGRDVTFIYGGSDGPHDPVTRRAVFDAAHKELTRAGGQGTEGPDVNTVAPIVDVRLSDLPWTPDEGDTVTVDGAVYTVSEAEPDGAGTMRLFLRKGGLRRW